MKGAFVPSTTPGARLPSELPAAIGDDRDLKTHCCVLVFFLKVFRVKSRNQFSFLYGNGNILLLLHLTKQLSVFFKLTPTLHFADFKNSSRFAFRFLFILYKKMKNNKLYYAILCKLKGYKDALLKFSI